MRSTPTPTEIRMLKNMRAQLQKRFDAIEQERIALMIEIDLLRYSIVRPHLAPITNLQSSIINHQ